MSGKWRSFEPEFKLQCVLDVLSGRKIPAQVCREHGLNESILARWRKQFAEQAPKIFANSKANGISAEAQIFLEFSGFSIKFNRAWTVVRVLPVSCLLCDKCQWFHPFQAFFHYPNWKVCLFGDFFCCERLSSIQGTIYLESDIIYSWHSILRVTGVYISHTHKCPVVIENLRKILLSVIILLLWS